MTSLKLSNYACKILLGEFSMGTYVYECEKKSVFLVKKTTFSLINGLGVTSLRRCFSYSVDNGIARSIDTSSYWL